MDDEFSVPRPIRYYEISYGYFFKARENPKEDNQDLLINKGRGSSKLITHNLLNILFRALEYVSSTCVVKKIKDKRS